jgi:hypothetical protein
MNLLAILLAAAMATATPHANSMMHSNAMHGHMKSKSAMHSTAMHSKNHMMRTHMKPSPSPRP